MTSYRYLLEAALALGGDDLVTEVMNLQNAAYLEGVQLPMTTVPTDKPFGI